MAVKINVENFGKIVDLCASLEHEHISPRMKQRICNAYDRAIDKALSIVWDKMPSEHYINLTLFRHAERGARDFIP